MPEGYEKIRDSLIKKGYPVDKAKEKAAKIWNSKHPDNPVTPNYDKKKNVDYNDYSKLERN